LNNRVFAGSITLGVAMILCAAYPAAASVPFVARPAATQPVRLLVKLPLRNLGELEDLTRVQSDPLSPQYHRFLSVAQFRARYSPLPSAVGRALTVLHANGLAVTAVDSQFIHVLAPAAAVERALHVRLGIAVDDERRQRIAADRALTLPAELSALNAVVAGLDYHRAPRPQLRRAAADNRLGRTGQYWFDDLKEAYTYPSYTPFNGGGVTIATVGYSDFSDSDAAAYFHHERLGGSGELAPEPATLHLDLGGVPFDPTLGSSVEADIDVQQAGGSAPGATIVGVSVPSGEGFLYGYAEIIENDSADIVSTSYGGCELFYTAAYNDGVGQTKILQAYHELFLQGNAEGMTFVFSSGDDAGTPCPQLAYFAQPQSGKTFKDVPGTSYWSSDPNATSVGGTDLITSYVPGKLTSTYVRESAFRDPIGPNDPYGEGNSIGNASWGSGGGSSVIFAKPWYQNLVSTGATMRSDPDVAMQMGGCPYFGPTIAVKCHSDDGASFAVIGNALSAYIGTSLSAPEFAGLLAVLEQAQGNVRFGNVNGYCIGWHKPIRSSEVRVFITRASAARTV
jgi:subtilase family serine protease